MSDLEKHVDWLDYKKKISAILNDEPLEIRYDPPIVEVQVSEEEWRKIQTEKYIQERLEFIRRNSTYGLNFGKDYERPEQEFHCGFEESGGHAYNCNDCPNKCEEWYQWDKEFKENKDDKS